jgi:hypothetical protein
MKRMLVSAMIAGSLLTGAVAPALAQGTRPADWQPLSDRRVEIAKRIDAAVIAGVITDLQARDLRDQFQGLLNLEDTYRKSGLTYHQREDLQARYDTLSARLHEDARTGDETYYPARAPADQ